MFQLYKKRDFSQLISDTISFFKIEGKNYFKSYFTINGGLLLILVVLISLFVKIFFEGMFSAIQNNENPNFFVEQMFSNLGLFIGLGFLMFFAIILVSVINYTFPVIYLKILEEGKTPTTKEIIDRLKLKAGRSILFFIISIFVLIPVFMILFFITFLLIMVIIGFPLLFILIPAVSSWIAQSYYHYINTNSGYFDALFKGYEIIGKKFWPIIGSTAIMYVIVQIILTLITFIPYIFGLMTMFTNPELNESNAHETFGFIMIFVTILMVISILFNYTLQNLILINQGIIYYSIKEADENISVNNEIESIGSNEE